MNDQTIRSTRRRVREDTFIKHRNSKAFRFFENRRATRQFSDTSPGQLKYLKAKIIYKVMRHKKYYGIYHFGYGLQTLWAFRHSLFPAAEFRYLSNND